MPGLGIVGGGQHMLGLGKETKSEVEFFVMFAIVNAVLSERVKQLVMVLNRMLEEDAAEWAKRERCRAREIERVRR
jgi:hypothetical protein